MSRFSDLRPWPRNWSKGLGIGIYVVVVLLAAFGVGLLVAQKVAHQDVAAVAQTGLTTPVTLPATASATTTAPTPSATKARPKASKTHVAHTPVATRTTAKPTSTGRPTTKKPPARPKANTAYQLHNVVTGKCLHSEGVGNVMAQQGCGSVSKLSLSPTREAGGSQLYLLRDSADPTQCVDPPGAGSQPNGTQVSLLLCISGTALDNQEFFLKDTGEVSGGKEEYLLVNFASNSCLDVLNVPEDKSDRADGLPITIADCGLASSGYDDHRWVFD